jgi:ankyrin repeat protein
LIYATISYSTETVQQFYNCVALNYGRINDSKDVDGQTALSYAARYGTLAIVQILLGDGSIVPDSRDQKNQSPLSYAAQNRTLEVVKALLTDSRIDPDSKCSLGLSPLSWAIEREIPSDYLPTNAEDTQRSIVRVFLETGRVDINSKDNAGRTPLIRAVFHQRFSILVLLLNYGCDIRIVDNGGKTALDWAQWSGDEEILQTLLSAQARMERYIHVVRPFDASIQCLA